MNDTNVKFRVRGLTQGERIVFVDVRASDSTVAKRKASRKFKGGLRTMSASWLDHLPATK